MPALRSRLAAAFSYLAIVLSLWVPFSLRSGMPVDTGFTYVSEISRWWNGFLNGSDLLRVHISTFYQVAYLLGELTGFGGSWVPYQIVYAALWWARGFLVFLIGRRLLPGHDVFWYLAGVFVLVHSSDQTLGWVGQTHQSGYIFWMLLAFYALILAFEEKKNSRVCLYLIIAGFLLHLSLWAYESQLPLLFLAPLLLWLLYRLPWRRWAAITAGWYAVPAIYIVVALAKYARSGGHTYQQSVLRKTWQLGSLLSDWIFNIVTSLKVWAWAGSESAKVSEDQLILPAVIATIVFLAGFALMLWLQRSESPAPERRTLSRALGVGLLLLIFSFPVYLVLESARGLWRTQILSGLAAGLMFASLVTLLAGYVRRKWLRAGVIAVLGGLIVWYGSYSALKKTAYHHWVWERYRAVIAEVIHAAPRVKPGTLVILTNVPKDEWGSPLGAPNQWFDVWFDVAMQLAYPGTRVGGLFFYSDGAPASVSGFQTDAQGRWMVYEHPLVRAHNIDGLLVLEYHSDGVATIARTLPSFLAVDEATARSYAPDTRIEPGGASIRAMRRYGP
ncbi:MAG TPA: hypothetical protein VEU96_22420 [Bryobacteraceae bacterium]|nr:hypothetical protein [Bryobacteraceae bacterium]